MNFWKLYINFSLMHTNTNSLCQWMIFKIIVTQKNEIYWIRQNYYFRHFILYCFTFNFIRLMYSFIILMFLFLFSDKTVRSGSMAKWKPKLFFSSFWHLFHSNQWHWTSMFKKKSYKEKIMLIFWPAFWEFNPSPYILLYNTKLVLCQV